MVIFVSNFLYEKTLYKNLQIGRQIIDAMDKGQEGRYYNTNYKLALYTSKYRFWYRF